MPNGQQNTEVQEQISVDEISNKIQEATSELNKLKNSLNELSVEEKNERIAEIENAILDCSQDLEDLEVSGEVSIDKKELDELKSKVDILKSEKESLKKQIETQTKLAIDELNQTVTQNQNIEQNQENGDKQEGNDKKGLSGWRNGLNKGQKWGLRIGGALAGLGILKLGKRIFGGKYDYEKEIPGYSKMSRKEKKKARKELKNSKRAESKSESTVEKGGFRDRPIGNFLKGTGIVVGTISGVYYLAHGIYTKNWHPRDLFDWERGKKLTFEDALEYSKGAIQNQGSNDSFSYGLNLEYNEDTSEIEAYGEKIKIDKKARKIEGMNVTFKKYEHMISAAIVIAFLKKNYAGICANNSPFDFSGPWRGNINVDTYEGEKIALDGSGNGGKILGVGAAAIASVAAAIWGGGLKTGAKVLVTSGILGLGIGASYDGNNIMSNLMPELDNEYGKKVFSGYLNSMNCWEAKNQAKEDITDSPLRDYMWECVQNVQDENKDILPPRGGRRKPDLIPDPNNPNRYTIKAYGLDIPVEVSERSSGTGADKWEIKFLGMSCDSPKIKTDLTKGGFSDVKLPLKEGIYTSFLLGFLLDKYQHKGNKYPRFTYGSQAWNSVRSGFGVFGDRKGLFFSDEKLDTYVLTERKFEDNMPTLSKRENRDKFLKFLNDGIIGDTNESIWKKGFK